MRLKIDWKYVIDHNDIDRSNAETNLQIHLNHILVPSVCLCVCIVYRNVTFYQFRGFEQPFTALVGGQRWLESFYHCVVCWWCLWAVLSDIFISSANSRVSRLLGQRGKVGWAKHPTHCVKVITSTWLFLSDLSLNSE